jgi:hypothetical protein
LFNGDNPKTARTCGDTKEMIVMHWLVKQLVTLIGACYAGLFERAVASLPYEALEAA